MLFSTKKNKKTPKILGFYYIQIKKLNGLPNFLKPTVATRKY